MKDIRSDRNGEFETLLCSIDELEHKELKEKG